MSKQIRIPIRPIEVGKTPILLSVFLSVPCFRTEPIKPSLPINGQVCQDSAGSPG